MNSIMISPRIKILIYIIQLLKVYGKMVPMSAITLVLIVVLKK